MARPTAASQLGINFGAYLRVDSCKKEVTYIIFSALSVYRLTRAEIKRYAAKTAHLGAKKVENT